MEVYVATGRRKEAVARVRMKPGSGKFVINGREGLLEYFKRETLLMDIEQPLILTDTHGKFDFFIRVNGGGLTGQAGAVRLGIARALVAYSEDFRPALRKAGFVIREIA